MHIDRYSSLSLEGTTFDTVVARIADWIVPDASNTVARDRRSQLGVPGTWSTDQLLSTADLIGRYGCRVQVSAVPGETYIARFLHRDVENEGVFWNTAFRLTWKDAVVRVEAGIGRETPRDFVPPPSAHAPRIFTALLEEPDGMRVVEQELTLPLFRATTVERARDLVDVLLLPGRDTPITVMARDLQDHPIADVTPIERRLRGIAILATLEGPTIADAFGQALEEHGYDRTLSCFNGGIHTYGPTDQLRTAHRLWLGRSLAMVPSHNRADYVGEALARRLTLGRLPPGFFALIEDFDRSERARRIKRESDRPPRAGHNEDVAAAVTLMEEANGRASFAEDRQRQLELERDRLALDLETARAQREYLQTVLDEKRNNDTARAIPIVARQALLAVISQKTTPAQALHVVQALYGDRVIVLPEAFESAEEARVYRNPEEVLDLLVRLAGDYWDAYLQRGDAQARAVFTDKEFAAGGSQTERNSSECISERTRDYRGRKFVMWRHLRAGGNGGIDRCLRVHFDWFDEENKVVIGHCGRHLKEA